jgi:hypothetical protein
MVVSGKAKVGPILGIVGSAILFVAGLTATTTRGLIEIQLDGLGLTWGDIGFDPFLFTIRFIATLVCAILGLLGAILALLGKKLGAIILLIFGAITILGSFLPMAILNIGLATIPITLIYPFFYIESILMLVGGILGLVLRAE